MIILSVRHLHNCCQHVLVSDHPCDISFFLFLRERSVSSQPVSSQQFVRSRFLRSRTQKQNNLEVALLSENSIRYHSNIFGKQTNIITPVPYTHQDIRNKRKKRLCPPRLGFNPGCHLKGFFKNFFFPWFIQMRNNK